MTLKEVWQLAYSTVPVTGEEAGEYETETILAWANMLAGECRDCENSIRRARGEEELAFVPMLTDMEDEIPLDTEICRRALPWGMASFLWTDEDEEYRVQDMRGRFIAALGELSRCTCESVVDVYA